VGEATEKQTLALRLVNRGKQVCVLDGCPRVVLSDARRMIPFRIGHGGGSDEFGAVTEACPDSARRGCLPATEQERVRQRAARAATTLKIALRGAPGPGVVFFKFPKKMNFPYRIREEQP
jgi:hypothetical protein